MHEVIIYGTDPQWCGSGGLFAPQESSYRIVTWSLGSRGRNSLSQRNHSHQTLAFGHSNTSTLQPQNISGNEPSPEMTPF